VFLRTLPYFNMSSSVSSYDVSIAGDFSIRPLKSADIPQISKLHADLLQYPYTPSFFRQFLLHSTHLCLIAYPISSPNTPIAFVTAYLHTPTLDLGCTLRQDPQVHILTLGVDPQYQRKGIARRLVLTAVHNLQESAKRSPVLSRVPVLSDGTLVTAQVATSNNGGKEFYEAMGMETEGGVVNDLYRLLSPDHRDAFVLVGRVH